MKELIRTHQKTLGIAVLLVLISLGTGLFQPTFLKLESLQTIARLAGLYGIIAVAAAVVISTGGIDLSMGSLIALSGVLFPLLIMGGTPFGLDVGAPWGVGGALLAVLAVSALVGLFHGLLITKLNLQPFLVTLCGLFIYRGLARLAAEDRSQGFGDTNQSLRDWAVEKTAGIPHPFLVLIALAIAVSIVIHRTVFGRHLLALGRNEQAARFSGIATDRVKITAYIICSVLAGLGGVMFVLDTNSALPSNFGNAYELYAIAGAVLGGCSLRGGECSLAGVVLGAAMVQVIQQAVMFTAPDPWKFTIIGLFILLGVIADEMLRRYTARRQARSH